MYILNKIKWWSINNSRAVESRWFNEKGELSNEEQSLGKMQLRLKSLAKWENFIFPIWFAPPLHVNPRKTSRKYKWHLNSVRSERGKQSNEECSKKFNYIHTQQLFQFFLFTDFRSKRRNFLQTLPLLSYRLMSANVVSELNLCWSRW